MPGGLPGGVPDADPVRRGVRLREWPGALLPGLPLIATAQREALRPRGGGAGRAGAPLPSGTGESVSAGGRASGTCGGVWARMSGDTLVIRQAESSVPDGGRLVIR